ncbi:hypothetical protein VTI74DRAFT_6857 [Chaetomium olivicolor]
MAHPPSYQDATTTPDWLELVARSIPIREYARLCLVSRRFYRHFAPRLWNEPLAVAGMLCQDSYDPEWLVRFLRHAAVSVRPETRALVTCLDLRRFAAGIAEFPLYSGAKTLAGLLRSLPAAFPRLRCLLLDRHPGFEPGGIMNMRLSPGFEGPLLQSISGCQTELPAAFFASPYLRNLVYLDVCDMPGSLKTPLLQGTLSPANLPNLRILKARGREMDNATACLLFRTFETQLWSLDLSSNKLTDGFLHDMQEYSFPTRNSRIGDAAVEGRLLYPGEGTASFGKFCLIAESTSSATFSHAHRYLIDAPFYSVHDSPQPFITPRLDGRTKIRPDSADAIKHLLSGAPGSPSPPPSHIPTLDICHSHCGISHLYLNNLAISSPALARLIRSSPGHLQHLECSSPSLPLPPSTAGIPSWLTSPRTKTRLKMTGILGSAHLFRPVYSANLQSLRIHHSILTSLPTLHHHHHHPDLPPSPLASLWLAETYLLPRAELAYPPEAAGGEEGGEEEEENAVGFLPDMNPRLQSLVLTGVPRYSVGRVVERMRVFLRSLARQEAGIQAVRERGEGGRRKGVQTVKGLRHLRLEFEGASREEREQLEGGGDDGGDGWLDGVDGVMDAAEGLFSFFGESGWRSKGEPDPMATTTATTTKMAAAPSNNKQTEPQPADGNTLASESQAARPLPSTSSTGNPITTQPPPFPIPDDNAYLAHTWTWNAQTFTRPIWIGAGPPVLSHTPAVQEYMRLVRAHPSLRANPAPVSPCHVRAGVPEGTYIFSDAWEAILIPAVSQSVNMTDNNMASSGGSRTAAVNTTTGSNTSTTSVLRSSSTALGSGIPVPRPARAELLAMQDVMAAIKAYRAQTRAAYEQAKQEAEERGEVVRLGAPHFHWTGRLEVMVEASAQPTRYYWR